MTPLLITILVIGIAAFGIIVGWRHHERSPADEFEIIDVSEHD